ncbi:hypothetical protein P5673_013240 [Acropora cervicornis]|uniref:C2H2-type domain-containing protein n=1 Tax=Acropora cervicornis TaxID=6130 RepID=A0AAD9V763_ACRCE|nr:hypothetical protein P5673_013240 [Acropora cervicornis]
MQDSDSADRPQRRSALVARELARLNIDIAAVSEVRFAEQGSLTEQGAGYTLYWSGKAKDDRRLSGVGFMIRNSIISRLDSLPVGHSDRLMSLHLPLLEDQYATIISLKRQLTQAGIDHSEWEALAEDGEEWRGTTKTAADNFEEGRKTAAAEKRQRRKDSASQPVTDTTFTCPSCSRACRSRIGLHSHQRACRRASTSS